MPTTPPELEVLYGRAPLAKGQRLETREAGEVTLPSGRLVVCDPFVESGKLPLDAKLPARKPLRVEAHWCYWGRRKRPDLAGLTVRSKGREPTRWEPATIGGDLANMIVDSATVGLMDPIVHHLLFARLELPDAFGIIEPAISRAFTERGYADLAFDPLTDANLLALPLPSDGFYEPIHLGYAGRSLVCVTVDCRLLERQT